MEGAIIPSILPNGTMMEGIIRPPIPPIGIMMGGTTLYSTLANGRMMEGVVLPPMLPNGKDYPSLHPRVMERLILPYRRQVAFLHPTTWKDSTLLPS